MSYLSIRTYLVLVLQILFYVDVGHACKSSVDVGAPFSAIIRNAEVVSLVRVKRQVELLDSVKQGVQFSWVQKLEDFKGDSDDIQLIPLLIATGLNQGGMFRAWFGCSNPDNLKLGNRYLYTPNFSYPNAILTIDVDKSAKQLYAQGLNEKGSLAEAKLQHGLKINISELENSIKNTVANCSSGKKAQCNEHINALLNGDDFHRLLKVSNREIDNAVFDLLNISEAYKENDTKLIALAISHIDGIQKAAQSKKNSKVQSYLKSSLYSSKLKIFEAGQEITATFFNGLN